MTLPVVHSMRSSFDIYVGRKSAAGKVPRVNELTGGYPLGHFGNQVVLGYSCALCGVVHEALDGLDCYSRWLWRRIREEPEWRAAVASLAGLTLACWCASLPPAPPKPCHAYTLAVAAAVLTWPESSRDSWDERAAILEHEAGNGRYQAELLAYAEVTG